MVKVTLLIMSLILGGCQAAPVETATADERDCGPPPFSTVSAFHKMINSQNKDLSWRDLGERDHRVLLKSYNQTLPPSDIKSDLIRFYYKPGAVKILLVIADAGCIQHAGAIPLHLIEAWLQGVTTWTRPAADIGI